MTPRAFPFNHSLLLFTFIPIHFCFFLNLSLTNKFYYFLLKKEVRLQKKKMQDLLFLQISKACYILQKTPELSHFTILAFIIEIATALRYWERCKRLMKFLEKYKEKFNQWGMKRSGDFNNVMLKLCFFLDTCVLIGARDLNNVNA